MTSRVDPGALVPVTEFWQQPLDLSALDPDDEAVAAEVDRRWAAQDFAVGPADSGDPLACDLHTVAYAELRRRRLTRREELTRQVRLAVMAGRNGATYGQAAPVTASPAHAAAKTDEIVSVDPVFADGTLAAEWGNAVHLTWGKDVFHGRGLGMAAGLWISEHRGYVVVRSTYLTLTLRRPVPALVLDSLIAYGPGWDAEPVRPSERLRVDPAFDKVFRTYIPQGGEAAARDVLPEAVRAGLVNLAAAYRITLDGTTVRFERPGVADFGGAEAWQEVWALRAFVEETWYPRLGEWADPAPADSGWGTDLARPGDNLPESVGLLPVGLRGGSQPDPPPPRLRPKAQALVWVVLPGAVGATLAALGVSLFWVLVVFGVAFGGAVVAGGAYLHRQQQRRRLARQWREIQR
ncbi:MAG: hypothetical protein LBI33_03395 [Propionibacteriaceae bacterium]|jgi:hypothetical protein|nr:hypothetical protein [Propionibacteriaceae bacterium]